MSETEEQDDERSTSLTKQVSNLRAENAELRSSLQRHKDRIAALCLRIPDSAFVFMERLLQQVEKRGRKRPAARRRPGVRRKGVDVRALFEQKREKPVSEKAHAKLNRAAARR